MNLKKNTLQDALNRTAIQGISPPADQQSERERVQIAFRAHKQFKDSLRLIARREEDRRGSRPPETALLKEALNDLFAKYNVPQVLEDKASRLAD